MRYVVVSVVKGEAGNFNNNLRKEVYEKFNAKSSKLPAHFTIKSPFETDNIIQLENIEEDAKDVYNSEEAWNIYLKGTNNRLLELAKARNFYIKKLDKLVDKYIEEKIYQ